MQYARKPSDLPIELQAYVNGVSITGKIRVPKTNEIRVARDLETITPCIVYQLVDIEYDEIGCKGDKVASAQMINPITKKVSGVYDVFDRETELILVPTKQYAESTKYIIPSLESQTDEHPGNSTIERLVAELSGTRISRSRLLLTTVPNKQ